METNEISWHDVEVWKAFKSQPDRWLSNKDISPLVRLVSARTVRAKTSKFVGLGIVDQIELFPQHRYRLSPKAKQRNIGYVQRLEQAEAAFAASGFDPTAV